MNIKYYCDDPELDQLHKTYASDAGYDIRCAEHTVVVRARESALISTKLYMAIPEGWVGIVKPRSGTAVKYSLDVGAGVIDAGYRGEVKVLLFNHSDVDYVVKYNDKIAQLVVVEHFTTEAQRVDKLTDLGATPRAAQGFGSTGVS